jgi:uncharacterized protein with HEPN domain
MDSRDTAVLKKISEEAEIIVSMIAGSKYEIFNADEKIKRAVCMTLINIGEMVKLLSDNMKQTNPTIPWRSIAGLRDVTAHGYQTLRMADIWETITKDIPQLLRQIEELLNARGTHGA